jgi:hypothetical protein
MVSQPKIVTENDKMQRSYRYAVLSPIGRDFDPEFRPELTPKKMLALGVFCGKYMTDCRVPGQLVHARLSPLLRRRCHPYVWRENGWIHPDDVRPKPPHVRLLLWPSMQRAVGCGLSVG